LRFSGAGDEVEEFVQFVQCALILMSGTAQFIQVRRRSHPAGTALWNSDLDFRPCFRYQSCFVRSPAYRILGAQLASQPSRIVFVIAGLETGGAELMLLKLLERLHSRLSTHVISLTTGGEIGPRIQALGIPVEALGLRPGRLTPLAFGRLVVRLKELRPDVVHTWMYHADLVGGLAAKLAGGCAIGWCIRNSTLDPTLTKRSTRLVARACALVSRWVPDRTLSCSETARQVHVHLGYAADRMVVLPNGFDLAAFRPDPSARATLRAELGVAGDTPLIGLVGRFDPQKNHTGFFEAAGALHRHLADAHFVLAGRGLDSGNQALVAMAASAGVTAVTHLLGLRGDVPRLMAAFDLLASSSYSEAFPNVLGEAMACGVPCVVTAAGDSAYIVGDSGRVVQLGDMPGLAAAFESVLRLTPDARGELGQRARARVASHFEIGDVVRRYEIFYDELTALARGRRGIT
jgi:glycosyltransferase involved in cell wall biosynthesis